MIDVCIYRMNWSIIMSGKLGIKNVQARIALELYDNILRIIKEFNEKNENEDDKLNIQKVMVEALNDWVRKNQKDPLLSLSGLLKKEN